MINIKIKNKKYKFDSIALAARTIIANPKDYNYNKVCRCGRKQTVKSMDVWLKRHKFTVDKDYVCKDCCHTEQFTLFGKTFNTYHEACRNKYVVSKLKCGYCGAKLEKSSHHYWVRELSKNPEKRIDLQTL